jgi:nitrite reductase/ring-hydroxylating ferredoxin subunit
MPMGQPLTSVAVYRRTVRASLERVWENVRDWEHLPWLHRASFSGIALERAGREGWRARIGLWPRGPSREILLDLRIDEPRLRYVSHTLEGPGAGTEIWTALEPRADAETDIAVEFLVPDVRPEQAAPLGAAFRALYTRLWDEDESMMIRRTDLLAARRARGSARDGARVALGALEAVRARAPFCVDAGGEAYRVLDVKGDLVAHAIACPHLLGPLEDAAGEDGSLTCPWHGYRYDLRSGVCAEHPEYRLPLARLEVDPETGQVELRTGPR